VQEKFKIYEAQHIGRIVEACYLGRLREIEKSGKTAYVNVELFVSFEDTSGRFQLFEETPPESLFDLEFYDVDLKNVWLATEPATESAGELVRCENCGTFGRNKSFMTNNPLWQQVVTFSFVAPKASEIAHEFEAEPDATQCLTNVACFIATACYGSALAPEVVTLRRFRDQVLLRTPVGRAAVRMYYRVSPPVARWLIRHSGARRVVREAVVAPMARLVRRLGRNEAGAA
jgi:hypothetical protein